MLCPAAVISDILRVQSRQKPDDSETRLRLRLAEANRRPAQAPLHRLLFEVGFDGPPVQPRAARDFFVGPLAFVEQSART